MKSKNYTQDKKLEIIAYANSTSRKQAVEKYNIPKATLATWVKPSKVKNEIKKLEPVPEPISIKMPPKEKRKYRKREPIYQPIEPANKIATKNFLFYSEDAASVLEVLKGLL